MVLYQQDNQIAFDILYRRHSSKVYGFLKKRLKASDLADDVFQATFLKFHRSRGQFEPSFSFTSWLFTVCRSVMFDTLRKRRLEPLLAEMAEAEDPGVSTEETSQPRLPLEGLPKAQREAIEMRYLEELNYEQIAGRLNTSSGNVRQLVSRGVRQLRGLITPKEDPNEG